MGRRQKYVVYMMQVQRCLKIALHTTCIRLVVWVQPPRMENAFRSVGIRVSMFGFGRPRSSFDISVGRGHHHDEAVSTYELGHEGNHEVEKTDGLDEGETQNGVREELATESRVAGDGVEEGGENETDTDTSTGQTDGGGTHTQVLGDLDHGLGDLRRVGAAGLESLAGGGVDNLGGLLALDGLEGVACTRGRNKSLVSQLVVN